MDGTLKQETTYAVDTAILLTSSGVFSPDGSGLGEPIPSALTCVGGMSLFQRAVFTLQRGGISKIWVLAGSEEAALRQLLHEDPRIQAAVRWLPTREFPPHDPQTWETLAEEVNGACMVVGCHAVYSTSLVQQLRQDGANGKVIVVVGHPHEGYHAGNPGIVLRREGQNGHATSSVMFQDQHVWNANPVKREVPDGQPPRLPLVGDMMVLPSRLLGISGVLNAKGTNPLRLALEQAAVEGMVQPVSGASHWFRDVRGHKGPQLAERTLLRSLQSMKGGLDGWVDRHINRKLSGLLTRGFLRLGWSPNLITLISMAIGLVAAGFFVPGTWEMALIGALLFQLSVVVDCCDGEVARLTFSESRFGQELDIWADNVVHMAIFAGIAGGAYLNGPWAQTELPLILGASAVLANVASLFLVNHARQLRGRPSVFRRLTEGERAKIEFMLSRVANRDFSVMVLGSTILGVLHWFLGLAAIGSWVFVMSVAWLLRRTLLSRA